MIVLKVLRLIALVLLLVVGVLGIALMSVVKLFMQANSLTLAFAQLWYRALLKVMNVKVNLKGHYQHQAALICCNHISWLDIPVLGSVVPTYFLSKAELRNTPILGWLAHHAGTLFIHRGTGQIAEVKQLMQGYLSADHCLAFFPEATTGNGFAIRRFHPRLFSAAIETETDILPIALQYHTKSQPSLNVDFADESLAENLWRVLGRWRTEVDVTLSATLSSTGYERKVIANQAMNVIADAMDLPADRRGLDLREPLPKTPPENRPQ